MMDGFLEWVRRWAVWVYVLLAVGVVAAIGWAEHRPLQVEGSGWKPLNGEMERVLSPISPTEQQPVNPDRGPVAEETTPETATGTDDQNADSHTSVPVETDNEPGGGHQPKPETPATNDVRHDPTPTDPPGYYQGLIDINTASETLLTELPGIGPAKAKAIVEYRNRIGRFHRIEELMNVKGIGKKTFDKLKNRITASP